MKNEFERTINASDLQEWIMCTFPDWCEGDVRLIYDHIDDMPSAQPEIIRCKDCKHFIRDISCVEGHYDGCDEWTDNGNEIMVAEDDFCSYAEKENR